MVHLPYGHINIYNIAGTLHASHFVQLVFVKYQIFNVDGVELENAHASPPRAGYYAIQIVSGS